MVISASSSNIPITVRTTAQRLRAQHGDEGLRRPVAFRLGAFEARTSLALALVFAHTASLHNVGSVDCRDTAGGAPHAGLRLVIADSTRLEEAAAT